MPKLILVRHGESQWNLEGRVQGQADCPLTDRGRLQAKTLGAKLHRAGYVIDSVYSSGLSRADETELIAVSQTGLAAASIKDKRLMERHWGNLQGKKGDDVQGERDRCLSYQERPVGGESFQEVMLRTTDYLESVVLPLLREGKTVACFGHQGSLGTIQAYVEKKEWEEVQAMPNGSARIYDFIEGELVLESTICP